jgi:hypothetical protein
MGRKGTTMLSESGVRSSILREPEIAALRHRVLLAHHLAASSRLWF